MSVLFFVRVSFLKNNCVLSRMSYALMLSFALVDRLARGPSVYHVWRKSRISDTFPCLCELNSRIPLEITISVRFSKNTCPLGKAIRPKWMVPYLFNLPYRTLSARIPILFSRKMLHSRTYPLRDNTKFV